MRLVNIFTVQRPCGNPIVISTLYKAFGTNIPHYLPLEGGDFNGPLYLFCIDRTIDIHQICDQHNYKLYSRIKKFEVDESKYNSEYQIFPTYFSSDIPYKLEKYKPSGYDTE